MKTLILKIKCLLLRHDINLAFSFKTGESAAYCKRCGKIF